MNTNKSRVIVTVMKAEEDGWQWVCRYNPGGGSPNLQAEGQSKNRKLAFEQALAEATRFTVLKEATA